MSRKIIGCDVSKDTIDVFVLRAGKSIKISNNPDGFNQFVELLPDKNQHVCMEATGSYYEAFADYLTGEGYPVSVVNPLKIKAYAEATFTRNKTDKQDAKLIARYCRDHRPPADYKTPTTEEYRTKRLLSHIRQLNKQIVSVKNRIEVAEDEFISEQLGGQLEDLQRYLKTAKKRLAELSSDDTTKLISSIPGIGITTAAVLSFYLRFHSFPTAAKFAAFAGLSPSKYESGTSVRKRDKLSSLGNRTLKSALYMPAVSAYRMGVFKDLVERMKKKGKAGKVIIVAIMRKLACLAFTLWQRQESYKDMTKERIQIKPA